MTQTTIPMTRREANSQVTTLIAVSVAALLATVVLLSTFQVGPFANLTGWLGISTYWAQKIFDIVTSWKAYLLSAILMAAGVGVGTLTLRALIASWIRMMGKKAARKYAVAY